MALAPGTRLGVYEVVALIGQGGMGEVYRARDISLKRDVALKILPAAFASDRSRVVRFRREASVLASLNHPGIAAIFGLVEGDEPILAIALELVDGGSLASRIARGALPASEAHQLARQVAGAVAAAHARGIIHRDLKPANIVVRSDGTAKVLDFGLAKAVGPDEAGSSADIDTVTAASAVGVVVGTPAYMSPEQATGGTIDARTDIWAFGCVLFEMLAGRRAFEGTTTSDTLTAVLTKAPDWSKLPASTSPMLRTLIQRCLSTDPRQRPPNMDTIVFLLDENAASSSAAPVAAPSARPNWMIAAAALVLGAALMGGLAWSRLPAPPAAAVLRTTIPVSASGIGTELNFGFTSDGRRLVYFSEDGSQMLSRPLDSLESTPILTTTAFLRGVFPSPDGRWIGFCENSFTLRKVPTAGGTPATLVTMDGPSRGATWLHDDTLVFATSLPETGLQQVPASGGAATVLTKADPTRGELDHVWPERLPGGRGVLFTVMPTQGGTAKLAVLDLKTHTWRTVVEGGVRGKYLDSGHLVYVSAGSVWAIRFDLSRLATVGAAVEVVPQKTPGVVSWFDVSSNGALVYANGIRQFGEPNVPTWVARDGSETPLAIKPGPYRHPRISRDGQRLAVADFNDIFLSNLKQPDGQLSRFTYRDEEDWNPVWMPDSRAIIFGSRTSGGVSNLFRQNLNESKAVRVTTSTDMQVPTDITPDGETLLLYVFPRDIQSLRLSGNSQPVTLIDSPLEERNIAISRDGKWMAYEAESAEQPGELNIYVRPYPDVDRRVWQITTGGGIFPVWAANGRELYFHKLDGAMTAVAIESSADTITVGATTDLFRGRYLIRDGTHSRQYDVAPDGRFLMLKYQRGTENGHFVLVQGWTSEVSRLVP